MNPKNHTVAVMADGAGKATWNRIARTHVPAVVHEAGHLCAVLDAVATKAETRVEHLLGIGEQGR